MSLVAVSIDKLDRMFCEVDLGQLKLGNAIHNRAVLLESLVPLFHTKASKDIPRLAFKEGGDGKVRSEGASSQGLLFIHRLSFFNVTLLYIEPGSCFIVRRARFLLFVHHLSLDVTPLYVFPYADHIHCILTLIICVLHLRLMQIALVGHVLHNIITWWCLWKYGFLWCNSW